MSDRSRISPPAGSDRDRHDIARHLENWQDKIESAYLYRALAKAEKQPALAEVYNRLALNFIRECVRSSLVLLRLELRLV
jgi:hypothetical protein